MKLDVLINKIYGNNSGFEAAASIFSISDIKNLVENRMG